jgi:hypothetical protein
MGWRSRSEVNIANFIGEQPKYSFTVVLDDQERTCKGDLTGTHLLLCVAFVFQVDAQS